MPYNPISNRLELMYEAEEIDLLQIGILNKSLHNLLNQVAIALLEKESQNYQDQRGNRTIPILPMTFSREDILIRARVVGIRQGSLILDLQPYIAAVANTPGAIAILQNLVANVIWAIAAFGWKVSGATISRRGRSNANTHLLSAGAQRRLSTKVQQFLKEIKEAGNGGKLVLKSEDEELTVELYPPISRSTEHELNDE